MLSGPTSDGARLDGAKFGGAVPDAAWEGLLSRIE
jgi:hypothetical protein